MTLTFDSCFSRRKVAKVAPLVPFVYREIERIAGRRVRDWPRRIECMTLAEIREGRKRGAGHGLYILKNRRIKINASMPARDVLLNVIHENLHHAVPQGTESQVDKWSDKIYERVTKKQDKGAIMAEPGQKNYHRRNLIMDHDLALKVLDWHGGQGSMLYSLGSTGLENYVSPSMLDAGVEELETISRKDLDAADRAELDDLIGRLDMMARSSSEYTTKEFGLGDVDAGYATWLAEKSANGKRPNGRRRKAPRRKTTRHKVKPRAKVKPPVKVKGRERSRPLRAHKSKGSVLAAALRRDK